MNNQRTIKLQIKDDFIFGAGVEIGAAGSHDEVLLELDFSRSPIWYGLTRRVIFVDALGQTETPVLLTLDNLVDNNPEKFLCPVPYDAKQFPGDCYVTVEGSVVIGETEKIRIVTKAATFSVLASKRLTSDEVPITPSQAEQIQAQITNLTNEIVGALGNAQRAESAAENANISATVAQDSATLAQENAEASSAAAESAAIVAEEIRTIYPQVEAAVSKAEEAASSAGSASALAQVAAATAVNVVSDSVVGAVRWDVEQTISEEAKERVRDNLGITGGYSDVVRYGAAQSLSEDQKAQARRNINAGTPVDTSSFASKAELEAHSLNYANPHAVSKVQIGLGNVDNTADADKPVSTAMQNALNLKANKTSEVTDYIYAAKWNGDTYSYEDVYPSAQYDLEIVSPTPMASNDQVDAYANMKPVTVPFVNSFIARGDVPTVDIPVVIQVTAK